MNHIQQLITNYMHIWASSANEKKSNRGRSNGLKNQVYGMQKLRDLILDLGINGNLIKVNKSNFRTITLGAIGQWGSGGTPLKSNLEFYNGNIPWLVIGDLNDGLITKSESHITDLGLKNSSAKLIPKGSLLIAMYGSIGKLGITGIECTTNQAIAFCIPDNKVILIKYLFFYLRSIRNKLLDRGQGLAQQNISQTILKQFKVQIPSLVKQEQIIAKIDELMPLCEQLEEQHINSEEAHEKLVKVLLDSLVQSKDAEEFKDSWQRIANHFHTLFTTEESIDELKQTLLQLAVMGKLVSQDPNDEPASELLKRIQDEKAKLINEGKIRKEKSLPLISENEKSFKLPKGWVWVNLQDVFDVRDGTHDTPKYIDKGFPLITSKNLSSGTLDFSDIKYISEEEHTAIKQRSKVDRGDILFAMIGSIGNPVIVNTDFEFSIKNVALFKPYKTDLCNMPYLLTYLNYKSIALRDEAAGAVQSFVSLSILRNTLFCMPPLLEQSRIVLKFNELMFLCSELKSRIQQARAKQKQIADVLVSQALH